MLRTAVLPATLLLTGLAVSLLSISPKVDPRIKGAFRRAEQNGWTYVHLEGTPTEIGFQHGYLLAPEIQEGQRVTVLELAHDEKKDWPFFRRAAQEILWPHIEPEYREELQGIAEGVKARSVKLDLWDVVATNAFSEWPYFVAEYNKQHKVSYASLAMPERCSAFVATGSYTHDGKIVIAHNNWTGYLDGERWTIIFDIVPAHGYRILMDGFPGLIHSGDDFGVNSAGLAITETTITRFFGWDSNGIPEFVRARKAMQYAASIDDFARLMKEGNNGGYANDWLVADRKTNEIASLELGLKHVTLERKTDGYFVSSNFPINPGLARDETDFKAENLGLSANARHLRWEQLMRENKGKIDLAAAERFLADHYDTYAQKESASERTLCGHVDLSARGSGTWQPPFGTAGTVQNKVADSALIERLSFEASAGHSCGLDFKAADHLRQHPQFGWEKEYLRDMDSHPWTRFESAP